MVKEGTEGRVIDSDALAAVRNWSGFYAQVLADEDAPQICSRQVAINQCERAHRGRGTPWAEVRHGVMTGILSEPQTVMVVGIAAANPHP